MRNTVLDEISEELFQDNINTEINNDTISWIDNFGAKNEIYLHMTATDHDMIAWWQCNEVGKELVRIKMKNEIIINWRPPINTMGLGSFGCKFIKFISSILVIVYNDKHTNRIFTINTTTLNIQEIDFYGQCIKIGLVDNLLFISNASTEGLLKVTLSKDDIKSEQVHSEYLNENNIHLKEYFNFFYS
jgi:hypothetical protein